MRDIKHDEGGQFSVYDSIMFFLILIIGSAVIMASVSSMIKFNPDVSAKEYGLQYTDDVLNSVLASTIHGADFTINGESYNLSDDTVQMAIFNYLKLKQLDQTTGDVYGLAYIRSLIHQSVDIAVKSNYNYALYSKYSDSSYPYLYVSDTTGSLSELPDERFASKVEPYTGEEFVEITLFLWRT
ncbi:MAG: hypothetical protein JSW28_03880 [Thermoplasmata archaeon]|nr:MAG: hypothetical protein JSW28_03880 [Thermoplasmata archaeon]